MVRKNWIVIGCCVAVAAMLCVVTYAGKCEMKGTLPAVVQKAVKTLFPNAVIEKSKMEKESVKMYEVKVKDNGREAELKIAADGTVAEVETVEDIGALPEAVAQAFKAQDPNVSKVEKAVEHAQLKLVKLDTVVTTYEAKIIRNGKESEVKVAANGTILKQEVKEKEEKEEEEHGEH